MTVKTDLLKKHIYDHIQCNINDFEIDPNKIVNTTAIELLSEIQKVIQNDKYSDFEIVEKIVCLFENYNIDTGACHDF